MTALRTPARTTTVAVVTAALAYAWWAATIEPFTAEAHAAVFAAAAVVLAAGSWARHRWPVAVPALPAAGLAAWAALVAAVVGFELYNFFSHPRAEHPTMSSLINEVDTSAVRRVMYAAWLGLGWHLARR